MSIGAFSSTATAKIRWLASTRAPALGFGGKGLHCVFRPYASNAKPSHWPAVAKAIRLDPWGNAIFLFI